ncbi:MULTISPECIES: LysR family transcriptional regulator [Aequorivita]|uniref:LysR family transcriptional regulator n=2 Tax=Aequorivita TaxID=153265 RepID=A0AB35Z1K2_9FLAO|nr:LysR family transcriptional regulator [Aequorivita sp. Ant34-E75]WGF93388.1 LysR family transcriptional regulator [Aequorivita sp. Ant34-E75]
MDFRLKVFKMVAEQLSFTKASKLLFISQPAVTKHINELEKQYGKPLFNRHGNSITLTADGEILLDYASKIIELYIKLEQELIDSQKELPKKISLAASTTIAQYILPSLLSKFKSVYPHTAISLINQNSERIEALVLQKKTDLGLSEGTTHNPTLHYEAFIKDEIVLATRIANTNLKSDDISLEELARLPIVIRESGSGTLNIIENALKEKGLRFQKMNIQIQLGSTESIKNYLQSSNAYAFLSIHSIAKELKNHSFKIVDVKALRIERTFQFVSLHGDYDKTAERLKNFFITHYNLME